MREKLKKYVIFVSIVGIVILICVWIGSKKLEKQKDVSQKDTLQTETMELPTEEKESQLSSESETEDLLNMEKDLKEKESQEEITENMSSQSGGEVNGIADMQFREVNETVTAKQKTNLREKPSQGDDSVVAYTLENGETVTRIGVSDSGWSKIILEGQIYYAVSSYLTTDLNYTVPTEPETEDDRIKTNFVETREQVTAKEAVNLRTLPSVTNEESQVVVKIAHGDVIVRTGINTDVGWSRVEYNGQVLYCISSYLEIVSE